MDTYGNFHIYSYIYIYIYNVYTYDNQGSEINKNKIF